MKQSDVVSCLLFCIQIFTRVLEIQQNASMTYS